MGKELIPAGVIYSETNRAFYKDDGEPGNGFNFMGQAFLSKWAHRAEEFPKSNWGFPY